MGFSFLLIPTNLGGVHQMLSLDTSGATINFKFLLMHNHCQSHLGQQQRAQVIKLDILNKNNYQCINTSFIYNAYIYVNINANNHYDPSYFSGTWLSISSFNECRTFFQTLCEHSRNTRFGLP